MNTVRRNFYRMRVGVLAAVVMSGWLMAGCTMGPRPGFAGDRPEHGRGFGGPPPPMDMDRMVDQWTRELNLTPDQVARIKEIMKGHQQEVHQQMEAGRQQMEKNRQEMDALRKKTDEEIARVLTDEQRQRFEEMCEKRRHHGPPPGGPHGSHAD